MKRRKLAARTIGLLTAAGALGLAVAALTLSAAGSAASNNLAPNPSLETGTATTPSCWLLGGYGNNSFNWVRSTDAHSGLYGETLTVSSISSGDRKLLTGFSSTCSAPAIPGHTFTISVWYKSTASAVIFAFTRRVGAAATSYNWWAQTSVPASSTWRQVSWVTPVVPSGIANLSAGMGLQRKGSVTMDDFSVVDNQGVSPSATSTTTPPVTTTTTASSATTTTTAATTTTTVSPPPTTTTTTTTTTSTTTDTTAPTSSIACNGGTCSSGYYGASVSVSLSATDNAGGSGVNTILYTTNGTAPTLTNGTAYTGAFTVASTSTVEYRAYDKAGNAEAVHTQTVQIDKSAPTVSLSVPATGTGTVALSANASDNVQVSKVDFVVDGTVKMTDTASPYTYSWNSASVSDGTHQISAVATDEAGNTQSTGNAAIAVTNTAPSSAGGIPSTPPPSDSSISDTLPSLTTGLPRSDASCADKVYLSTWEPITANTTANHSVPTSAVPWSDQGIPPSFTKWYGYRALVTGNYTGTTDEIIQWAACKWGVDPDLMRAVAVQESDWHMSSVGDYCGVDGEASYGLFQVKNKNCQGEGDWGGWPATANDTGLNADFYGAQLRACLDGYFQGWLYGGSTITQIISASGFDYAVWGCVGAWFSGDWYDSGAKNYISGVKQHLAARDWLTEH
jgi:hypothetical protein